MPQPRIPKDIEQLLFSAGLLASCYQPTFLFPKDGRKLPNCSEPSDPWQVILRRDPEAAGFEYGVQATGVGPTLRDALLAALAARPGLSAAMVRLGNAIQALSEVVHARQD
jgi:hypothetical protein